MITCCCCRRGWTLILTRCSSVRHFEYFNQNRPVDKPSLAPAPLPLPPWPPPPSLPPCTLPFLPLPRRAPGGARGRRCSPPALSEELHPPRALCARAPRLPGPLRPLQYPEPASQAFPFRTPRPSRRPCACAVLPTRWRGGRRMRFSPLPPPPPECNFTSECGVSSACVCLPIVLPSFALFPAQISSGCPWRCCCQRAASG